MKPIPASEIRASAEIRRMNPHIFGTPQFSYAAKKTEAWNRAVTRHGEPVLGAIKRPRQPTKTELQAKGMLEASGRYIVVLWNSITLRMSNSHRYTPDLLCRPKDPHEKPTLVEVKGTYRMPTHGRSRLAFDQARIEFGWLFAFTWLQKRADGSWGVE